MEARPRTTGGAAAETPPAGPADAPAFRYADVVAVSDFQRVLDDAIYRPVPDSWSVAITDVVESGAAIAAGRYREVNFVGAATIASLRNALGGRDLPFTFGGDGAAALLAPEDEAAARVALSETATWAREAMGLRLRAALIPVAEIRAAGRDLRVARYAPSPDVAYAMVTGGGLAFAERALKAGRWEVAEAPAGARPDLSGLSCRFEPTRARRGIVLSIVAIGRDGADPAGLRGAIADILRLVAALPAMGRPLPEEGPMLAWPPAGVEAELGARPGRGPRAVRRLAVLGRGALMHLIFRFGLTVGGFVPGRYRREMTANADFQKYDDGLRMTIDCDPDTAGRIEDRLLRAERDGILDFGLHRQGSALVTCITPAPSASDHVHFIDGEGGGYARAAGVLKAKLATGL
ncbi:DUF3095 domain-containing protein [Methylobacterium oryzihabitans]|uniref:DUF3095 domain-containing protein n=1 Tax=Methylobacterium oryzihabitans TaxID=2499852 RepID=A0A3S2VXS4_9HYPH|nr:DUF3095 domain-containing protein [Methylobacterium oryzihabitans]RVU20124.1 DUF3095 domain-containing protein [Methylobacterium oryzihabitans]